MNKKPAIDFGDLYYVAGVCLLAAGAWWIYPPASLLLVGAIFLVMALRRMLWA